MKRSVYVAFAIACGVPAAGIVSSEAQVDLESTAARDAKLPAISVVEDTTPDSLHLWHLYERPMPLLRLAT